MKWSNGWCVGALENNVEGGHSSGRAWQLGKMESGGCGFTERREDRGRTRAGVVGGQGSVLRRKKEQVGLPGFQLRAPATAPSQQPSADNQGVHGNPEPRGTVQYVCDGHWCLGKGRPQGHVRTGRRSSLDAPEPALSPKRRVFGGDSAGAPRELEGTQESRDRGELVRGKFRRTGGPQSL